MDQELVNRGAAVDREWENEFATDYKTSELTMALPPQLGAALLVKHWDHLQFCSHFVQAALYVGTPTLLDEADKAIKNCPNPRDIFKYIDMHYGIRTKGRDGVTDKRQLEALVPYLDYMDEHRIYAFWEVCNDHGWIDFRQNYLDDRLKGMSRNLFLDEARILSSLDEVLVGKFPWIHYWVEQYLESGASRDKIISVIRKWLASHKTLQALKLAAHAVAQVGSRDDLKILDVLIAPEDAAAAEVLLADTAFAVKRRSLA